MAGANVWAKHAQKMLLYVHFADSTGSYHCAHTTSSTGAASNVLLAPVLELCPLQFSYRFENMLFLFVYIFLSLFLFFLMLFVCLFVC